MNPWTRYAQNTLKLEKKYQPLIEVQIRKFRAKVISDLKAHGVSHAQGNMNGIHLDTLLPLVQSIYKTSGLMGAKMAARDLKEQLGQKDISTIMSHKAGGFGRNEQWIQAVIDYLKLHLLEAAQNITETMKADILKVFEQSVQEGWGIDRMVQELMRRDIVEARARVIARTEINIAANAGHKKGAESMPYEVDKGWVAARDHRTRDSHVKVNGQWVGENDTFKVAIIEKHVIVGYEEMDGPGDPDASAQNIVNCRCRRLYRPKRDAQGNIVLRNPNQATIIPMRAIPRIPAEQIAAILKSNIHIGID